MTDKILSNGNAGIGNISVPKRETDLKTVIPDRGCRESKSNPRLFFNRVINRNRLDGIAKGRFHWEGLPDGLTSVQMEELLHYGGMFGMVDTPGGVLFGRATLADQLNFYGLPTGVTITGFNAQGTFTGSCEIGKDQTAVYFWPCKQREMSAVEVCRHYSDLMTDLDMLMRQNVYALAMPYIFEMDAKNEKDFGRYMSGIFAWQPWVAENNEVATTEKVRVKSTNVQCLFTQITDTKHSLMQEFLTVLGIDNSNTDKRERVQSAEVISNNEEIMNNRGLWLRPRKDFCEECNRVFGLNMSVTYDVGEWSDLDELSWISEGSAENNSEFNVGGASNVGDQTRE